MVQSFLITTLLGKNPRNVDVTDGSNNAVMIKEALLLAGNWGCDPKSSKALNLKF